jgi:hypothetical protein
MSEKCQERTHAPQQILFNHTTGKRKRRGDWRRTSAQIGGIHLVVGQRECWPMPLTPAAHVRVGAAVP